MSNVYDLNNVQNLINEIHPSALIVVDSDIIARIPDYNSWRTSLENPLFMLPCIEQLELNNIINKHIHGDKDSLIAGRLSELCQEGQIEKGIYRKGTGWFISAPAPDRNILNTRVKKLNALIKAVGFNNTHLLIFSRELTRLFPNLAVILATPDKSLADICNLLDINAYHFKGFPMSGLDKRIRDSKGIDWDGVLQKIQLDSQDKLVEVELTLLSKGRAPEWIQIMNGDRKQKPVIMAKGVGVLKGIKHGKFTWLLPFFPWEVPEDASINPIKLNPEEYASDNIEQKKVFPGNAYLDFGGMEGDIPPNLQKSLISKLNDCVSPLAYLEDMPTVQDPVSVMKQFFLYEMFLQNRRYVDNRSLRREIDEFENKLKEFTMLTDWAYYWFNKREVSKEDKSISFNEFMYAVRSCWNIGETVRFDLVDNSLEFSNLPGDIEK
jgi:hypothetical protein